MRSPCASAALDPPLWKIPDKALSLSSARSLFFAHALARALSLSLTQTNDTQLSNLLYNYNGNKKNYYNHNS
jgi:hypothetical protein